MQDRLVVTGCFVEGHAVADSQCTCQIGINAHFAEQWGAALDLLAPTCIALFTNARVLLTAEPSSCKYCLQPTRLLEKRLHILDRSSDVDNLMSCCAQAHLQSCPLLPSSVYVGQVSPLHHSLR